MLEDILPRGDIELAEGDILVLLGSPANLNNSEKFLLTGR
jgi:Trk K+ transport system NAD-binding subunit